MAKLCRTPEHPHLANNLVLDLINGHAAVRIPHGQSGRDYADIHKTMGVNCVKTGELVRMTPDAIHRIGALLEDTRDWWAETLACQPDELEKDEEPTTADPEGLPRLHRGRGAALARGAQAAGGQSPVDL